MKSAKKWGRVSLILALPIAACSTVVGADFDDLGPAAAGGSSAGAGAGAGGGGSGGTAPSAPGGAGAAQGGSASDAGAPTAGAMMGGAAGEATGGVPSFAGSPGADAGSAGSAGDGGGGGGGGAPDVGVPPIAVVINELKGQGPGDDYIELYNPGAEAADLGGCYVTDGSNENRVTLPEGAAIAANGFVVIRLQQDTSTGMVTECFDFSPCYDGIDWGISAGGESIFLHDSKGVLLDQLNYPDEGGAGNVGDGNAFGRIPDGAETTGAILKSAGAANNAVP